MGFWNPGWVSWKPVRVSGDTPGRSREPPGVFLETRAGFMETRAGFHNPGWVLRAPLRDPEGLENAGSAPEGPYQRAQ